MSLTADSPLGSSSSDDFAAVLDAELASSSSEESPDREECNLESSYNDFNQQRVKRQKIGDAESVDISQVSEAMPGSSAIPTRAEVCTHPGYLRDMCIACGKLQESASGIAFRYIHEHLKLGTDEIARLRVVDLKKLLRDRKLYLVLDLDHTLLNSTLIGDISPDEEYLKQGNQRVGLYSLDGLHMLTKLRPFVQAFLKEASTMFEMYVYTMAERKYALEVAKLLDPSGAYFASGVISKLDSTQRNQKGLDIILGAESALVILDDTENVWQKHKDNLILMERYHYFSSSCREFRVSGMKSLAELRRDECESEGVLATILKILKQVHQKFFDAGGSSNLFTRDVRLVLGAVRQEILRGCRLVFTTKVLSRSSHLWAMAKRLGATCLSRLDASVTHVVSDCLESGKVQWAVRKKKFVVHPRWIEAATFLWQRQPEEQFAICSLMGSQINNDKE